MIQQPCFPDVTKKTGFVESWVQVPGETNMLFLCSASILGQNNLLSHKKKHPGTVTSHLGWLVKQRLLCKIGLTKGEK